MIALALLLAGGPQAAAPDTDPATWITPEDYPAEALRANAEGRVRVDLAVDRSGAVTGCTVVESSGSAALDAATCALMRTRAHFTSARDAGGRPLAATVRQAVRWQIPREALADQRLAVAVMLDQGKVASCTVSADTGEVARGEDPCAFYARPDVLRAIVGDALDGARSITVAMSMTVGEHPPPPVRGRRFVIAEALFTLGEDGAIASCTPRPGPSQMARFVDLCAFAAADPAKFDGKAGDAFTFLFAATVE